MMNDNLPPSILSSAKPYLLRALWEWCADNGFTPHITVAVDEYCQIPKELAQSGEIVFNINAEATHNLQMQNDFISFQARFNGVTRNISFPVSRVAALYARETGMGMGFPVEETSKTKQQEGSDSDDTSPPSPSSPAGGGSSAGSPSFLRRVK